MKARSRKRTTTSANSQKGNRLIAKPNSWKDHVYVKYASPHGFSVTYRAMGGSSYAAQAMSHKATVTA